MEPLDLAESQTSAGRRLTIFVCLAVLLEVLSQTLMPPLLPELRRDLQLSKASVGLLSGIHALGLMAAALPVAILVPRAGVRRCAFGGLLLLAASSAAFGLARDYDLLLSSRLVLGVAGAVCFGSVVAWLLDLSPRSSRPALIGMVASASAAGTLLGPGVGGLAAVAGRAPVFLSLAAVGALLAAYGLSCRHPRAQHPRSAAAVIGAHRSPALLTAQWTVVVPGLLLGTVSVLGTLSLSHLGWTPIEITGVYLLAAATAIPARPAVGRWAARAGLRSAYRLLLLGCVALTVAVSGVDTAPVLAAVLVVTVIAYGLLWGPAMMLASHAYEAVGLDQITGFSLMNLTIGLGSFLGPTGGGAIGGLAGDAAAYAVIAGICLGTIALLRVRTTDRGARGSPRRRMRRNGR